MSLKVRFNDIGDTLHCSRFFVEDDHHDYIA